MKIQEIVAEAVSTNNAASYATGTFTPAANAVLIAVVYATGTVIAGTGAGGSLTWTIKQINGSDLFVYDVTKSIRVFEARVGGSPSSMSFTFDCTGDDATGATIVVYECKFPLNSSGTAIRQIGWGNATSTNPTATFSSAPLENNAIIYFAGNDTNPFNVSPPSGYTEIADTGYATPTCGQTSGFLEWGQTATTVVLTRASSVWGMVAIEVEAAEPTTITKTIGTSSRDYATITAWIAAIPADLTAVNEKWVGNLYNDSVFDERATITGKTTSKACRIVLTAPTGQRHTGTLGSGVRDIVSSNLSSGDDILHVEVPHVDVSWIQFGYTGAATNVAGASSSACKGTNSWDVHFSHILVDNINISARNRGVSLVNCSGSIIRCQASRIRKGSNGADTSGIRADPSVNASILNNKTVEVANCTVHDTDYWGIEETANAGCTVNVRNCLSFTNATADFLKTGGAGTESQSYCVSSDATATGTGSIINAVAADTFVNPTNSADLHLKAGASAIGAGTDLSASGLFNITTDIDGMAVTGSWDIGSDQRFVNTSPSAPAATITSRTAHGIVGYKANFSDTDVGDVWAASEITIVRTDTAAVIFSYIESVTEPKSTDPFDSSDSAYSSGWAGGYTEIPANLEVQLRFKDKDDSGDAGTEWSALGAAATITTYYMPTVTLQSPSPNTITFSVGDDLTFSIIATDKDNDAPAVYGANVTWSGTAIVGGGPFTGQSNIIDVQTGTLTATFTDPDTGDAASASWTITVGATTTFFPIGGDEDMVGEYGVADSWNAPELVDTNGALYTTVPALGDIKIRKENKDGTQIADWTNLATTPTAYVGTQLKYALSAVEKEAAKCIIKFEKTGVRTRTWTIYTFGHASAFYTDLPPGLGSDDCVLISDDDTRLDAVDAAIAGLNDLDAAGIRTAIGLASANLDIILTNLDTAVQSRLLGSTFATYLGTFAADVRTALGMGSANMDTQLTGLLTQINTRLATAGYTAPPTVSAVALAVIAQAVLTPIAAKLKEIENNLGVVKEVSGEGSTLNPWGPA